MKHRILAAALLTGTLPLAQAQSSVTLYGIADAGLVFERGGAAGNVSGVSGGMASGNRIGIKGQEVLDAGLTAFFQLENGFNIDTGTAAQGGALFGRQAYVGLSGKAGAISLGRQYTDYYNVLSDVADPFGTGMAGDASNIMAVTFRVDNVLVYQSPRWQGWAANLAYGAGEQPNNSAGKRSLGATISYEQGPLSAHLVHFRRDNTDASDHARNTMAAVKYHFGPAIMHLAHARNQALGQVGSHDTLVGLTVPFGPHQILASLIVHRDTSAAGRDAEQKALGYLYSLSKRSDLYAAYGHVANHGGANFTVGNGNDAGSGHIGIDLGLRHRF